jgi:hypothetical protein
VSGNAPGAIAGTGIVAPPVVFAKPIVQTTAIAGKRIIQPMTSGTAMRFARFVQKPRVPSFWCITRAKNPAMKKNSDMRKMCVTKAASERNGLGELSEAAQMPGGQFGMNERAA